MALPRTWGAVLAKASGVLLTAGIEGARRDARILLAAALETPPDRLAMYIQDTPDSDTERVFNRLIERRTRHEPVSHLVGGRWFWGRWFEVSADVLDPRPETEVLVREALAEPFSRCLDLGTGSGCILVSLLADRPEAEGVGIDISGSSLDIAMRNAVANDVGRRATFAQSDWWQGVEGRFDLIVSNPPYLADHEVGDLAADVRDFEPRHALTDGGDGLGAYRAILDGARNHMLPGARLLVEIGPGQAADVTDLMISAGLTGVVCHSDFDGRDRVIGARTPPEQAKLP